MTKPKITTKKVIQLMPALTYITETTGDSTYYDRVWDRICENSNFANGVAIILRLGPFYDEQETKDMELFRTIFEIKEDTILAMVSW